METKEYIENRINTKIREYEGLSEYSTHSEPHRPALRATPSSTESHTVQH